jgi:hypothetical protein
MLEGELHHECMIFFIDVRHGKSLKVNAKASDGGYDLP